MKKFYGLLALASAMGLAGAVFGAEPQVAYDFTQDTIGVAGALAATPRWLGQPPVIRVLADGKRAAGFEGKAYFELADAKTLHADQGLTLWAEVRFTQPSKGADGKDTYDMICFKNNEFLLGRTRDALYFNLMLDGKWKLRPAAQKLPVGEFITVAATLSKIAADKFAYKLFLNGKTIAEGQVEGKFAFTDQPLQIGRGWGQQWMLGADLTRIAIYPEALSDAEILSLSESAVK